MRALRFVSPQIVCLAALTQTEPVLGDLAEATPGSTRYMEATIYITAWQALAGVAKVNERSTAALVVWKRNAVFCWTARAVDRNFSGIAAKRQRWSQGDQVSLVSGTCWFLVGVSVQFVSPCEAGGSTLLCVVALFPSLHRPVVTAAPHR